MKSVFAAMILLSSFHADAALSGYWDSVKKIQTALENPQVAQGLRQSRIKKISVDELIVTIESEDCSKEVLLKAIPSKYVGPVKYEVEGLSPNDCR